MKKTVLIIFCFLLSCSSSSELTKYFNEAEAEALLTNIVTYVYQKAPYSTNETRFKTEFKSFYASHAKAFKIEKLTHNADGNYIFFMTRPVGNTDQFRRGVIGKFRLAKGSMMPLDFEEIVNTPHLKEKDVLERGAFLYNEYIKAKNLDKYLEMKHYIEWPDSTLVYDKKINEWVSPKTLSK